MSSLIRLIAADYGILKKEWVEDLSLVEVTGNAEKWWNNLDEVSKLRMSMGLAWEGYYLPQIPEVVHQPGEMCVEGIYMTHDGESLDIIVTQHAPKYVKILHECKLSYKSIRTVGEDLFVDGRGVNPNWMWLCQCRAYCKGLNTTTVYLHVLFVAGDYTYPIRPQLRVWKITFTQQEIDETWELLVGYLRQARLENEGKL